jgi:hypothetical protein
MELELLDFMLDKTRRRVALILLRYHELLIECDIVYYPPKDKVWVRMPEYWYDGKKTRLCFWPSEAHSDEFQDKVLNLVYLKHNLDIEGIRNLYLLYK